MVSLPLGETGPRQLPGEPGVYVSHRHKVDGVDATGEETSAAELAPDETTAAGKVLAKTAVIGEALAETAVISESPDETAVVDASEEAAPRSPR